MLLVIVARQELVREGLVRLLGDTFPTQGVADLSPPDIDDAEVIIAAISPGEALSTLPRLQSTSPRSKLLAFLLADDFATVLNTLKCRVHGVVDQSCSKAELIDCIRQVMRGEFALSRHLGRLLASLHASGDSRRAGMLAQSTLTRREAEVLRLLAQGFSNKDIAASLSLSEHTVRAHLRGIMQKLHVNNRVQAAALAWQVRADQQSGVGGGVP